MNLDDLQQTIQRLTKEKFQLVEKHNQDILFKKKQNQELEEKVKHLINENEIIAEKYNELEDATIAFTQRINSLLSIKQLDHSLDDKQIIEDLKKLDTFEKQNSNSIISNSRRSVSELASQDFEMHPLETAVSNLQKAWLVLVSKTKLNQGPDPLIKYYKQQISTMEDEQRTLRTQYKALQQIHNQSQKSRHEIAERMRRQIQIAIRSSKLNLDNLPSHQMKQKMGIYLRAIEQLNQKISRLQQELYSTKSQYTQKLQIMKHQSAKIKEKTENDMVKKDKQINSLRNSLNKK